MRALAAAAVAAFLPIGAFANTVDFTEGTQIATTGTLCQQSLDRCFSVDGFAYDVDNWHNENPTNRKEGLTLDDDGHGGTSTVHRLDGQRFSVYSVFVNQAETWNTIPGDYDGLLYGLYGIRAGVTVAAIEFGNGVFGDISLFGFTNLDQFVVRLIYPKVPSVCYEDTCTHLELTNMVTNDIATVPIPASLTMLLAGFGALWLWRRRQPPSYADTTVILRPLMVGGGEAPTFSPSAS